MYANVTLHALVVLLYYCLERMLELVSAKIVLAPTLVVVVVVVVTHVVSVFQCAQIQCCCALETHEKHAMQFNR